jgi:AraC-like DNA-binding protein
MAWRESTFGRDQLCREVGLNRHLVLQSVRSQGYNNVHDYINRYRIEELKRMIRRGEVATIGETVDAGFGTVVTVRSCFKKMEGITLDEFMASQGAKTRRYGDSLRMMMTLLFVMACTVMLAYPVRRKQNRKAKPDTIPLVTSIIDDMGLQRRMSTSAYPVQLQVNGRFVRIQSDHDQILPIYNENGVFYMAMRLKKGTNWLSGLPRGSYFINNRPVKIG